MLAGGENPAAERAGLFAPDSIPTDEVAKYPPIQKVRVSRYGSPGGTDRIGNLPPVRHLLWALKASGARRHRPPVHTLRFYISSPNM